MTEETQSPATEPNSWDGDAFDRAPFGERVAKVVAKIQTPRTIALNGGFGTGKTWFLDRVAKRLEQDGHHVVIFNAWRQDIQQQPLEALTQCLMDHLPSEDEANQTVKDLKEKMAALLSVLQRPALRLVGNILTSGVANELVGTAVESLAPEKADETPREAADNFREALEKYAAEARSKRLIFLIDELDRCRPDFALSVLEKAKHVFDAVGVVFLFATHKHQLEKTAEKVYGDIGDGDHYLQRFFNVTISLPSAILSKEFVESCFYKAGLSRPNLPALGQEDFDDLVQTLTVTATALGLSLREVSDVCQMLTVAILQLEPEQYMAPGALALLACISLRERDLGDVPDSEVAFSLNRVQMALGDPRNILSAKSSSNAAIIGVGDLLWRRVLSCIIADFYTIHELGQLHEAQWGSRSGQGANANENTRPTDYMIAIDCAKTREKEIIRRRKNQTNRSVEIFARELLCLHTS